MDTEGVVEWTRVALLLLGLTSDRARAAVCVTRDGAVCVTLESVSVKRSPKSLMAPARVSRTLSYLMSPREANMLISAATVCKLSAVS